MTKKHESDWKLEQLTETEIYAAIHELDPEPGSANKQLAQPTDREIYSAIRYLDPDPEGANEKDHFAAIMICVGLVLLVLLCLEFVWFYH